MDTRWKHPFTSMLCGPTGCGKTVFVKKFLKDLDRMCDTKIERVIVYYAEWQPSYKDLGGKKVEFHEGLPQTSDWSNDPRPKLVIIDDLMRESSSTGSIVDIFSKASHHHSLSVIFITQNVFHQGKGQRDISLNSQYIVLFRNLRDRSQIQHLSRQLCPENSRFLQEAYWDATSKPFGYLLLDLKQTTPDNCRYRTSIFPDDEINYVYVPRKKMIKGSDSSTFIPVASL